MLEMNFDSKGKAIETTAICGKCGEIYLRKRRIWHISGREYLGWNNKKWEKKKGRCRKCEEEEYLERKRRREEEGIIEEKKNNQRSRGEEKTNTCLQCNKTTQRKWIREKGWKKEKYCSKECRIKAKEGKEE